MQTITEQPNKIALLPNGRSRKASKPNGVNVEMLTIVEMAIGFLTRVLFALGKLQEGMFSKRNLFHCRCSPRTLQTPQKLCALAG